MDKKIEELAEICRRICDNDNNGWERWRNLKLVPEAYDMLLALPLDYDEEVNAANRVDLLEHFAESITETDIPRFSLKLREYQLSIYDMAEGCETSREDIKASAEKLKDYLNPRISVQQWCKKYGRMLLFDDVERSPEWEACIYDVELELAEQFKDEPRGMGFCFSYWSAKTAALARRGISWDNPHITNPRVMFD